MKTLQQEMILSLTLLLLVPLLVAGSSSSDINPVGNITRGSSLYSTSLNHTTGLNNHTSPAYWLSPSGNLAFGFYKLPRSHDRYVVGIWFVKSPKKTLVWTANPNDLPLNKPSSILFTDEGKLVLRVIQENIDRPLLHDIPEPASYAEMRDDGNFVLYGLGSQIVWQSFDRPTDTILGGQKLRPGVDLISGDYRLSVKETNGDVTIYEKAHLDMSDLYHYLYGEIEHIMSYPLKGPLREPVILSLDTTGELHLANYYDDQVAKVFYQPKEEQQEEEEGDGDWMYRATLSSTGDLNLHKERIDGNDCACHDEKSSSIVVWSFSSRTDSTSDSVRVTLAPALLVMSVLTGVTLLSLS